MSKENPDFILLNIGFARHYADWNYKNVHSPFARIYLVKEGRARLHLSDTIHELTPGHLYLIPPFTLHSYECDDHYSLYYIHLYENQSSNQRVLEDFIYPVETNSSSLDNLLVERLFQINPDRELKQYDPLHYDNSSHLLQSIRQQTKSPGYTIIETTGILYQLYTRFLPDAIHKYGVTDNRVRNALRYIRKHIDHIIVLDELADICYLSKDHFIRLFKKEMGITPVQYINQKKIEKAQLMLITGQQSIKDIAYQLSFDNISYFNRLFRKYAGVTPSEYKEKI